MLLEKDFLDLYHNPPFTELGEFTFYRTYSRLVNGRRETWKEVAARAVEYNCSLAIGRQSESSLKDEAATLFHNHFFMHQFLSGRTLWVGGTPVAEKFPMSNFNCSFMQLKSWNDLKVLFYLLLIGSGVGFKVTEENLAGFEPVNTETKFELLPYNPVPAFWRAETTFVNGDTIVVGDSKEGWVDALGYYFEIKTRQLNGDYRINFDNIRPRGEILKTFGGTASGPEALMEMFEKVEQILSSGALRTVDLLDIANLIGQSVVVGGVRRTSEMCIFEPTDDAIATAKDGSPPSHRFMSNNSVWFEEKPTREQLKSLMNSIRYTGEPGLLNGKAVKARNPFAEGVNPCGEALLADRQMCNLTTVNVASFVDEDGNFDEHMCLEAIKLSARAGLRMTLLELELDDWNEVHHRDNLVITSLTGWKDMVEATGITEDEEAELLRTARAVARSAAEEYAKELGINPPLLVTAVKPEGTLSLLPTVSSGLHWSHSPYYIRRVRIEADSKLCKVAEQLGWEVKSLSTTAFTKVIEFPVKAPVSRTKFDVPALEQLENYKRFMENYCEHNASTTITVKEDEWDLVEEWVWDNWDNIVGLTFFALTGTKYELPPYEEITEEEYKERKGKMLPFDPSLLGTSDIELGEETCEGGACPVR